ncbi:MAG: PDC sensor domain-containing protein [Sulfurimonas sp.]|nr:PDC sensor domain-containing protein [Sulfurimonas sp.]
MVAVIQTYQKYKNEVEKFLLDNIENNILLTLEETNLEDFFNTFSSLQLLYVADEHYNQSTPSFSRTRKDPSNIGKSRMSFIKNKKLNDKGSYVSSPYICSITGNTIITVVTKVEKKYLVMDFNLTQLLDGLGYVNNVLLFTKMTTSIYAVIGVGLIALSFVLIFYSFFSFSSYIFESGSLIEITFKAIISLTLSLAVFDLGKNLLEHEVVFKDSSPEEHSDNKMFIKFLISIITALSIEALMLVLKISLTKNYADMTYAVWLILGVSVMIAALALFYKMTKKGVN